VNLDAGNTIPADGLYIGGQSIPSHYYYFVFYPPLALIHQDLSVDESPMTGESDSVRKSEEQPFMISSCMVSIYHLYILFESKTDDPFFFFAELRLLKEYAR
jgi:hypothetical protein